MRVGSLKVANLEYLFVPHIPFPWGRFSIFHPDAIYQLCLSNNLLNIPLPFNVPLPFLSLLTSLSRGFYAGHPSTSDQLSFHGVFFFFLQTPGTLVLLSWENTLEGYGPFRMD